MYARFTHDCECCKFLGHRIDHDWYVCGTGTELPTLIARRSNAGPDYWACLVAIVKNDEHYGSNRGLMIETAQEMLKTL